MALPLVIPREQPINNGETRKQVNPGKQINIEVKKTADQENKQDKRITQSALGSIIEPPPETPRRLLTVEENEDASATVSQLEIDISDQYRNIVTTNVTNQEPQAGREQSQIGQREEALR